MEFLVYICLGFLGGSGHWAKKRFVDETTILSFYEYLANKPIYTKNAILAIIIAEIGLCIASSGSINTAGIFGALTAGYTADSGLNRVDK